SLLFFYSDCAHRYLHSFPTRRSSDLLDRPLLIGVRAMRCMACGAEMVLVNVVEDNTISVSGFEHHTFMCSECHDIERRLMFTKQDRKSTRLNSSHQIISYAVFCLKNK